MLRRAGLGGAGDWPEPAQPVHINACPTPYFIQHDSNAMKQSPGSCHLNFLVMAAASPGDLDV